jgi:hypothetical protein
LSSEQPEPTRYRVVVLTSSRVSSDLRRRQLLLQRSGYRKDANFLCTSVEQSRSARRYSGSRGEDIIDNENALVFDQTWIAHTESLRDSLSTTLGVHASAMPFGMNGANKAYVIER